MKKEGNKKIPIPTQEIIDNPIPTSLFLNRTSCTLPVHKQPNFCKDHKKIYWDGAIDDFLCWCRHIFVPFLFHDVTSLNFREIVFPPKCSHSELRILGQ